MNNEFDTVDYIGLNESVYNVLNAFGNNLEWTTEIIRHEIHTPVWNIVVPIINEVRIRNLN
jgi:hypothetical protein